MKFIRLAAAVLPVSVLPLVAGSAQVITAKLWELRPHTTERPRRHLVTHREHLERAR
jgi:hypothetical protein